MPLSRGRVQAPRTQRKEGGAQDRSNSALIPQAVRGTIDFRSAERRVSLLSSIALRESDDVPKNYRLGCVARRRGFRKDLLVKPTITARKFVDFKGGIDG